MSYTNIPKPTGANYTKPGKGDLITYDQSDTTYDDMAVFYDGYNPNAYTNLAKPATGQTWSSLSISWATVTTTWDNSVGYTNISKPT